MTHAFLLAATLALPISRPDTLGAQMMRLAEASGDFARDAKLDMVRANAGGDSAKDGALKGAVIGGAAAAAFWFTMCRLGDDSATGVSCIERDLGIWAVAGAAVGASMGGGIDALHSTTPRLSVSFRF